MSKGPHHTIKLLESAMFPKTTTTSNPKSLVRSLMLRQCRAQCRAVLPNMTADRVASLSTANIHRIMSPHRPRRQVPIEQSGRLRRKKNKLHFTLGSMGLDIYVLPVYPDVPVRGHISLCRRLLALTLRGFAVAVTSTRKVVNPSTPIIAIRGKATRHGPGCLFLP